MNVGVPKTAPLGSMFNKLKSSDINILIVGETGVGKSTFVNAFANYINFPSLQDAAESEDIISVIPSKFSIMDDNFETRVIKFGEDKNECDKPGSSATIDARMYRVPYGDRSVILIDTPGVGDTNGIERDEKNLQNLLAKIAEFKHLHAILILLKPNDSRVSVLFKYCIKQLLSSLEKSASLNIVFLFTNSRGTFYKPGDTVTPLRAVLKEIEDAPPFVKVPFNKTNTFCVDNEAFRFLIAKKNQIDFTDDETKEFGESWNRSAKEICKLLEYIMGLRPHNIQDTVSVNTSRTLIIRLSKPLAEISQNIADNIKRLEQYYRMRNDKSLSIKELQKKLVVKRIGLKINPIDKPMTVCGDKACVSHYSHVNGSSAVRYAQICHQDCQLTGIPKEELGDARLTHCWAMQNGWCRHSACGHNYRTHMHVYYVSEPYEYDAEDETVSKDIRTNEEAQVDIDQKMATINRDLEEYKCEQDVIQDAMAKFAHFIKHHAITPINDAYKDYILYFIDLQKKMGEDADVEKIRHFQTLIAEYEERVNLLERKLKDEKAQNMTTSAVSSADIEDLKNLLCSLPLYGETIKQALEAQSTARYYDQIEITEVKPKKSNLQKTKDWFVSLYKGKPDKKSPNSTTAIEGCTSSFDNQLVLSPRRD